MHIETRAMLAAKRQQQFWRNNRKQGCKLVSKINYLLARQERGLWGWGEKEGEQGRGRIKSGRTGKERRPNRLELLTELDWWTSKKRPKHVDPTIACLSSATTIKFKHKQAEGERKGEEWDHEWQTGQKSGRLYASQEQDDEFGTWQFESKVPPDSGRKPKQVSRANDKRRRERASARRRNKQTNRENVRTNKRRRWFESCVTDSNEDSCCVEEHTQEGGRRRRGGKSVGRSDKAKPRKVQTFPANGMLRRINLNRLGEPKRTVVEGRVQRMANSSNRSFC